jgi:hypothetical protein
MLMKARLSTVQVHIMERTLRRALENVDEAEADFCVAKYRSSVSCEARSVESPFLREASLIQPVASHTFS